MNDIASNIKRLRKEKGMTQKDLAERMSVTDKAVSKWERDLSCPDVGSIPQLAEVLEVSVEELLSAAGPREADRGREDLLGIILWAVPLAMGVAVAVASLLGELDPSHGFTMVGIGLACLALGRKKPSP